MKNSDYDQIRCATGYVFCMLEKLDFFAGFYTNAALATLLQRCLSKNCVFENRINLSS